MQIKEIKVGGVYKTTLLVQFRSDGEVIDVTFFVRVLGISSGGFVEMTFLNDPNSEAHFLNPSQIEAV